MSNKTQDRDPNLETNPAERNKHTEMASEVLKLRLDAAKKLKP